MTDQPLYTQSIEACLDRRIGANGLTRAGLDLALTGTAGCLSWLRERHADRSLPLLQLPALKADLPLIEARAAHHRARAEHVVVLGTGGSSLGGRTLYALADAGFGPSGDSPRIWFLDNVDPHTFAHLFRAADLARTDFIVISKSGGTAETLAQFLICLAEIAALVGEDDLKDRVTVITEPGSNVLRDLAEARGLFILDHDPNVGGRYSALSLVGLLPAAIGGLDIAAVRAGAHAVLHATLNAGEPAASEPAVGAAVSVGLMRERGLASSVLMPYVDRLASFARWYRQLWAESLGKGGHGTTPVDALGTVDQHSQLQLYLDGPRDKLFTFLFSKVEGSGPRIDPRLAGEDKRLEWLVGRTMGDLLDAEQRATADALVARSRPVRIMEVGRVDEETVGALMMHFMLETIITAYLLDVDPFDQPAVEDGKRLTREHMAAMGGHWRPKVV